MSDTNSIYCPVFMIDVGVTLLDPDVTCLFQRAYTRRYYLFHALTYMIEQKYTHRLRQSEEGTKTKVAKVLFINTFALLI